MTDGPSRQELESAYCWEADDRVSGRPEMTAFRRALRLHQARWREAHGHPIGWQPIAPRPGEAARPVGSRLPLAYARETGANFLGAGALAAARARTAVVERHKSLDHQRLWADLLWSPSLAFNLFGELAADLQLADPAVHTWWPDAPGAAREVRFAHSPGWLDPAYLGNLMAFDAAFVLALPDGKQGIIGLDVRYHEQARRAIAKPARLPRYREVAERSGVFLPGATDAVDPGDLLVTWLEHLLLLSMLQHGSGAWGWGRYVVVHPAANSDVAGICARYPALLADATTFSSMTLEELLDAGALAAKTVKALRKRYIPDWHGRPELTAACLPGIRHHKTRDAPSPSTPGRISDSGSG